MGAQRTPTLCYPSFEGTRIMWGPRVPGAGWLWSDRVLDVVGEHVDTDIGEVAEELLAMQSQSRDLLLGIVGETHRARVFAAVDQLLARSIALEVLRDAHNDKLCWRLIAEVQAMTRFDHPNLVRGYDFGVHDGWPYLVMELCDQDLETWAPGRSAIVSALRPALAAAPLERPLLAEFLARLESLTEPKGLLGWLWPRWKGGR